MKNAFTSPSRSLRAKAEAVEYVKYWLFSFPSST